MRWGLLLRHVYVLFLFLVVFVRFKLLFDERARNGDVNASEVRGWG